MTRQQAIYTALQDLYDSDLNSVAWSIYENTSRLGDDDLWRNLDLSEIMYDINDCYAFEQFLQAAADGDFNPRDDYWRWTCYGPESSDTLDYDLDDFAEIIDDHADDNWVHNELPREITDVLDEYASEPEDDDTDWPEDATDYDGVDDPDEDEPAAEPPEQEPMRHDALMLEAMRVISPAHPYHLAAAVQEAQQRSQRALGRKIMTCAELHDHLRCLGYMLRDNL